MSTARDDDPDLNPGEYGFSDPAPAKRAAAPTKHDKYATSEPEGEEAPKPRKRKRRDGDPRDEPEEPKPKKPRRDLAYDDPPQPNPQDLDPLTRPRPWWFWTVCLSALGLLGTVVAAVYVATKASATVAGIALVGGVIGAVAETAVISVMLVFIGQVFGIDYGPIAQAVVKLFGSVAFINGFTLGFGVLCYGCIGPLGILIAVASISLVAFATFQAQFQLNMYEALLTVFVIEGCAWVMFTGLGMAYMGSIK
jgi:hypothetical protein